MKKLIHWLPRILSILITILLAMFIAEGFDPEFGWQAGVMHGVIALIALGATIGGWKWPKIGGWPFVIFGIWYLIAMHRGGWASGFILGVVPLVTGALFLISGWRDKRI